MSTLKRILVVGLSHPPPASVGPEVIHIDGQGFEDKIKTSEQRMKAAGYTPVIKLESPNNLDVLVKDVRNMLRSTEWDGYIVGFGIRGVQEFTETFEKLVNAGREIIPETRMGFNTRPDDLEETVMRMFESV